MSNIANNLSKSPITVFGTKVNKFAQRGFQIPHTLPQLVHPVELTSAEARALFVAAYLSCLGAVCAVRFLAIAPDLPTSAHQTGKSIAAAFGRTFSWSIHVRDGSCGQGRLSEVGRFIGYCRWASRFDVHGVNCEVAYRLVMTASSPSRGAGTQTTPTWFNLNKPRLRFDNEAEHSDQVRRSAEQHCCV